MHLDLDKLDSPQALWALALPVAVNVVLALLLFFVGRLLLKLLVRLTQKVMRRSRADETLVGFVANVITGLGLALIIISALGQLGINTTSLSAVVGGAALAVGLALQNQLASFAAGVMLIIFRPFRVGDGVKVGGISGTVEEIKIVVTQLRTDDNDVITVPNAKIWGEAIVNTSERTTKRIDQRISITYDADLRVARRILEELLTQDDRILKEPPAKVHLMALGDHAIELAARPWTKSTDNWAVQCDLREAIKLRFDDAGIEFASQTPLVNLALPCDDASHDHDHSHAPSAPASS